MIYLLGCRGFLGSAVAKYLGSAGIEYAGIDRGNYADYAGTACDVFINANGNSKKWLADKNPAEDFMMNVVATMKTTLDFDAEKYVFISTIDVYSDTARPENNSESAAIEPEKLSNYGFHKYSAEQIVRKYCGKWLILRLGGMVGNGLKKNPIFDVLKAGNVFVGKDSEYQYMNSADVARIMVSLLGVDNEIINVCGDGTITVGEAAAAAGADISSSGKKTERYDVSIEKLKRLVEVPKTRETVFRFIDDVKSGRIVL